MLVMMAVLCGLVETLMLMMLRVMLAAGRATLPFKTAQLGMNVSKT